MTKFLTVFAGAIMAGLAMVASVSAEEAKPRMTVIKSPYCGCCTEWVKLAQAAGYQVEVVHREDLAPVKQQAGVPEEFGSCHTALVGQYVVEGHVPLEAVDRMLAEKPEIRGLAVPGMPQGSPGMGGEPEAFDVVTFKAGTTAGSTTWMSVPAR